MTTPPRPPAGSPASQAYRSQAGHYDRRTDAFRQWLEQLVAALPLRPGSPVAATGGKQPALWMWPLRPWVTRLHQPFITDFTGFDRPWHLRARYLPDLQVRELACTAGYLAVGHTPA